MDIKKLCVEITEASKSLTPLEVKLLSNEGHIAKIRIVAEAFISMNIPERIRSTISCLNAYEPNILKKFDITFELLSPTEDAHWNNKSTNKSDSTVKSDKAAAPKDLES